jgi:hypothetical protein
LVVKSGFLPSKYIYGFQSPYALGWNINGFQPLGNFANSELQTRVSTGKKMLNKRGFLKNRFFEVSIEVEAEFTDCK